MSNLGDLLYRGMTKWKRLPGNKTGNTMVLTQTGTGKQSNPPEWIELDIPTRLAYKSKLVSGGIPGDVVVSGIGPEDDLVFVTQFIGAGVAVTDVVDLTSEFTITSTSTINNTGGTDTTGDKLQVFWIDKK